MNQEEIQAKIFTVSEPNEAFAAIRMFFRHICSQEMVWLPLDIAAKILEKEKISDPDALNILAAMFSEKCMEMEYRLETTYEKKFFRKNLFIWDWVFLDTLIKLGIAGRSFAKKIVVKLEDSLITYRSAKESAKLLGNWFVEPDEESQIRYFHSPIFLILAEAIWFDLAKNLWIRKKKMCRQSPKVYGPPR
jgi:hypothetical protein